MTGSFPPLTGDELAAETGLLRAKDTRTITTKYLRILSSVDVLLPGHDENTSGYPQCYSPSFLTAGNAHKFFEK
jgi:hypothetical protein